MTLALIADRGLHKRPGGWSPKELGTLSLWLDAGDATTITGTAGAVTVARWEDKSGNGRHVYQNTGTARPTRVTSAHNSRATVRFNGTSHYLFGGDMLDFNTGGLSVMAVSINNATSSGTTTANAIVSKQAGSFTTAEWLLSRNGFAAHVGALREGRDTTNPTTLQVIGGVLDRQAGVYSYRNGTAGTSDTAGFPNTTSYNGGEPINIGAVGLEGSPSGYLNGDICEIVLSLATWSTGDRQKVEGYLAHRWGLSGDLPGDHPYKSSPPSSWTPASLGTLSLWLDADDATTFATETVTNVSQWDDKSGNAYHVAQATGANQPAWVKSSQNGRPAMRFTQSSSQYLSAGDVLDLGTGSLSVIVAMRHTASSYVLGKSVGVVSAAGEYAMLTSSAQAYFGGANSNQSATATAANVMQVRSWVLDRAASNTVWSNGTQNATTTASPIPNSDSLNIAQAFYVGGVDANYYAGDLFEVVVSLTALSTGDRQKCEGYLAHKWGTVSALPSDHPYKNAAP